MKPTHTTHVPVTVEIPHKQAELISDRPPLPTPSLWQPGVRVRRKIDGREAAVIRVDHATMQFRPYWLDTQEHAALTEWDACSQYDVVVERSPAERARDEAAERLAAVLAEFDARELGLVEALAVSGTTDPTVALAKIEAMRAAGIIGGKVKGK